MDGNVAADRQQAEPAPGREIGSVIAGVFGIVFVAVNSTVLVPAAHIPLLALAGATVIAILALIVRNRRASRPGLPGRGTARGFGRGYWTVVALEAVALFGGAQLISGLGHPELGVCWVAFVVGTHFFALGRLFRLSRFHLLGALVTACAVTGCAVGSVTAPAVIAVISGVVPGFLLLAFALWALAPRPRSWIRPGLESR